MTKRDHQVLSRRLIILLAHLLKCQFQPSHISNNWRGTIGEQRKRIHKLMLRTPSLANFIDTYADAAYRRAVRLAAAETQLPTSTFPPALPYTQHELLDHTFIPGGQP
ncbi:MAG: DUF29 domain-containing protein [Paludibacterium sp.]|uniref:DUF29 domain-containing protein n=1 Tax=Paludibacterium sp. TaxID=1917523 RepID=UPI00344CA029|nr:DUF29 domain-containing protein [Paludibacterium sp.]